MAAERSSYPVRGPLAASAQGFASALVERGYSASAVNLRLWLLDSISQWLEERHLLPDDLTSERAQQFLADRRSRGYKSWVSSRSLRLPLEYLRAIGVVPRPVLQIAADANQELVQRYLTYLARERGLKGATIQDYGRTARLFMEAERDGIDPKDLCTRDVTVFVSRQCARRSVSSAKHLVAALRSWLRYLHVSGVTATLLSPAVPAVAGHRGATLPRGLSTSISR